MMYQQLHLCMAGKGKGMRMKGMIWLRDICNVTKTKRNTRIINRAKIVSKIIATFSSIMCLRLYLTKAEDSPAEKVFRGGILLSFKDSSAPASQPTRHQTQPRHNQIEQVSQCTRE